MPNTPRIASSDEPSSRPDEPSARIVVQPPEGLSRTLVSAYLDDCRKDLSVLNAALVARDYERARVFGHQMKATGSPYGFSNLTRLGTAIEQAAAHKDTPELDHLVNELQKYLRRVEIAAD